MTSQQTMMDASLFTDTSVEKARSQPELSGKCHRPPRRGFHYRRLRKHIRKASVVWRKNSIRQHRADIGLGDHAAIDLGVTVKPPHRLAAADRAHVVLDGVAGHHRFAELALVDGEEIHRAWF